MPEEPGVSRKYAHSFWVITRRGQVPERGKIERVRLNEKNRLVESPVDHSIESLEEASDVGEIIVKVSLGERQSIQQLYCLVILFLKRQDL